MGSAKKKKEYSFFFFFLAMRYLQDVIKKTLKGHCLNAK